LHFAGFFEPFWHYGTYSVIEFMKIKLKTVLICLAFIAASSLAFDSYFNSRAKCLRKSICKVMQSRVKSTLCCQAKVQPVKTSTGKCKNQKRCCFKKPSPIATIDSQFVFSANHTHPVFLSCAVLTQSNFIPKIECLSTGPPFQFNDRGQSVLCVFII
jgi:hypothetical protein